MAKEDKFLVTPNDSYRSENYKGCAGDYDGEPGLPKRSKSKDGVPELTYEDHGVKTGKKEVVYESRVTGEQK